MGPPKRKSNRTTSTRAFNGGGEEKSAKRAKRTAKKTQEEKGDGADTSIANDNQDTSAGTIQDASESDIKFTEALPEKNAKGQLEFPDHPNFRPNLTPKEVLHAGSFGGTYFRPIHSSITGKQYTGVWKELPKDWLEGLDIGKQVSSSTYRNNVNTYEVKCGGSLEMWEESGWMNKQDPYGWFQWYCRFYQGRRSDDDERQIGRWSRCAGVTGRWRNNLISKCVRSSCAFDNHAISPVVRQTLQHWAYTLTKEDHDVYAKKMKKKA